MGRKSYVMLAVLMVSFLTATIAQAHCGKCGMGDKGDDYVTKKVEKLTAELGLDEGQAKEVEGIIKDKMAKKKAIKEEKQAKMDALGAEYKTKMKAVLNDDQNVKFDAMMAEWEQDNKKGSDKGSSHEHKGSDHEHKGSMH